MAATRHTPHLRDIRIKPDVPIRMTEPRACAEKGCTAEASARVPKGRHHLSDHIWMCQAHARAHNESWDYFAGMSEQDIERFRDEAITGHRPTWPMGKRVARMRQGQYSVDDRMDFFGADVEMPSPRPPQRKLTGVQEQALAVLNLEVSASLQEIKARYKELVKRFHPDANGGDRGAEERLKQVIKAYGVLRAAGLT